jgi:hypothetical protein
MDILRFLFYAFLFYLANKLVFDFIIPVYRTTKKVKQGFREMQERMNQHAEQYQQNNTQQTVSNPNQDTKAGDYIEFEEVK